LKLYLRELPTSILTSERREDFVKVTEIEDKSRKIIALNDLVHSLPSENFALLKALSGHLLRIVDNCNVNKMTIRNVGIVFSPTLNIPAQVFSLFLYQYRYIFFRNYEEPLSPKSPSRHVFENSHQYRMSAPPTPSMMFPVHPAANRVQGSTSSPLAAVSQEAEYDQQKPVAEASQISSPRFDVEMNFGNNESSSGASLAVPGDTKTTKIRRRESSMMFMMGGLKKGNVFANKSNGEFLFISFKLDLQFLTIVFSNGGRRFVWMM
jgi:RalA-binding protein 1